MKEQKTRATVEIHSQLVPKPAEGTKESFGRKPVFFEEKTCWCQTMNQVCSIDSLASNGCNAFTQNTKVHGAS